MSPRSWVRMILSALLAMLGTAVWAQGSIVGRAYIDEDSNGRKSVDEVPLEGVEVQVIGPGFSRMLVTNKLGNYSLTNLKPGRYLVMPPLIARYNLKVPHPSGIIDVRIDGTRQVRNDLAYAMECVEAQCKQIRWDALVPNRAYVTFSFKNMTQMFGPGFVIDRVEGLPPFGASASPTVINGINLGVGVTKTYTFVFDGVTPTSVLSVRFLFHNRDMIRCCIISFSVKTPDADCLQVTRDTATCNVNGTHSIKLQLQNLTTRLVNRIVVRPKPSGSFQFAQSDFAVTPGGKGFYFNLPLIVQGTGSLGQTRICFNVFFYQASDALVCTKEVCVDLPPCNESVQCPEPRRDRAPRYLSDDWFPGNPTVAVVTSWSPDKYFCPVVNGRPVDPVLTVFNLAQYRSTTTAGGASLPHVGLNWTPQPLAFWNQSALPEHVWSRDNLGSVFGTCLDDEGNIYVAQSSAYNVDLAGMGPLQARWPLEFMHGRIFRIANGTGAISLFNQVPSPAWNRPDPTIANKNIANALRFRSYTSATAYTSYHDQRYPELGDVTFGRTNGQGYIYASNMEDGTIYKYSVSGGGMPLSAYRHGDEPDDERPGFAPLGELIWAVQYHCERLYYSVWVEDLSRVNATRNNEVWSVGVDPATGDLLPATRRCEVVSPILPFSWTSAGAPLLNGPGQAGVVYGTSSPISDISFSPEGRMMIAERGMGWDYTWVFCQASADSLTGPLYNGAFTNHFPYHARIMEFEVVNGVWTLRSQTNPNKRIDVRFGVGGRAYVSNYHSNDRTGAGGVDYDFGPGEPNGELGRRVWATVDYLLYHPYANTSANGLQGLKVNGDDRFGSVIVDHDGYMTDFTGPNVFGSPFTRKYWDPMGTLGDVEIPLVR